MLALRKSSTKSERCHPNLLPCKIAHNGPVDACERYWKPEDSEAASEKIAFFRGRKLRGRVIKLPHSHAGSIVRVTDGPTKADEKRTAQRRDLPMDLEEDEEMDDEDQHLEETVAEELATFDEITVWGHDRTPEAAEDAYVMAVEEWIGLAQAIHSTSALESSEKKPS